MNERPRFDAIVPLRCFERVSSSASTPHCGAVAGWMRDSAAGDVGFYCAAHRRDGDRPLGDRVLVRRVSIIAEVIFTAVDWANAPARIEAIARLQAAAEAAGAALNLMQSTSTLGYAMTAAPSTPTPGARRVGQVRG